MANVGLKRLVGYSVFILAVLILAAQLTGLSLKESTLMPGSGSQQDTQVDPKLD